MRDARARAGISGGRSSLAALAVTVAALILISQASAAAPARACAKGELAVATGCASPAEAGREVVEIAKQARRELGLEGLILRVDSGRSRLVATATGASMDGVAATVPMHFRIGAMAVPYLTTLVLELVDRGKLSLDDTVDTWLPSYPNSDRVTLRMLLNNTSGYPDWLQGSSTFEQLLYGDVFRRFTPSELIDLAFARPVVCEPGTCFSYAHTNYAILSQIVARSTGRRVAGMIRERVLDPLGLRGIEISRGAAIPPPALHSYVSDRGPYEDATFWSPSWTLGSGTVMTGTVGDVARSARAVGTGALVSRRARREMFAPAIAALPGQRPDLYFGLGILVANGWRLQNPMINGYTGLMAYLPSQRLSVAITATAGEPASRTGGPFASIVFDRIAAYLSPAHQPPPELGL